MMLLAERLLQLHKKKKLTLDLLVTKVIIQGIA